MGLEVYTGLIKDMVLTNPEGTDPVSQGDDHVRGVKYTLAQQFEGFTTADKVTVTAKQINDVAAAGITQSDFDVTPGRLTKVGDYGLGSADNFVVYDLNALVLTGFFMVSGGSSNLPLAGAFGYLLAQSVSNDEQNITQLFTVAGLSLRIFSRVTIAGVWQPWEELATSRNSLGLAQTWFDVTGSRVFQGLYTNDTGRPIMVFVTAVGGFMEAYVAGVLIGRSTSAFNAGALTSFSFVVPVGATYAVGASGSTIPAWSELR